MLHLVVPALSAKSSQSHEDSHLSHRHLRRPDTDMEFRDSFSRLKKKVKHQLTGSKPKPEKTGADVGGSRLDPTGSHLGSEPHFVASGGHDQEGRGANVDEGQITSTIQLPQPDEPNSVPTPGSANDEERGEADVDGRGIEQTHSQSLSLDVGVTVGSEPSEGKDIDGEKVERVDPSPPTASMYGDKPDSM